MIKLKDILNEITNDFIDYGYHFTSKANYEKIQKDGLRINQSQHFTYGDDWIKNAYGITPIFLSLEPLEEFGPSSSSESSYDLVLLKVDVRGLDIAADLGLLIDHGAYIEEDGFWFKRKPNWLDDDEYSYEDLQGSDTFHLRSVIQHTRTFVVLQDIEPSRIVKVDEPFSFKKILSFKNQ